MTIHELLALTGLTGSDEIPVWDEEASGEPTKKITAQNFAAAIKTLASLLGPNDVVNDLTSTSTDKPLSAAQGKALNDNISDIGQPKNHGSISLIFETLGYQYAGTYAIFPVVLPFVCAANAYNVTIDSGKLFGLGNLQTSDISVSTKYNASMLLVVNRSDTAGKIYEGTFGLTISY